ncbi:hypothetical protein KIPB_011839 [Kipferlia bialata]|uniref:Uncharacterized protein n=1 Tax=Kipferlia bialata TaxID=797122 RepID=A0A9K3D5B6_9EUKA|nr:hypothetical protein KIPB_011839 [Kipferlia bialata]|eukprot:g11839.t1
MGTGLRVLLIALCMCLIGQVRSAYSGNKVLVLHEGPLPQYQEFMDTVESLSLNPTLHRLDVAGEEVPPLVYRGKPMFSHVVLIVTEGRGLSRELCDSIAAWVNKYV